MLIIPESTKQSRKKFYSLHDYQKKKPISSFLSIVDILKMSHIEEEFEEIERNHGWNMLFRVGLVSDCFLNHCLSFHRNLPMIMVFEH